jgi:MFS superfamily sulfate permease-like transporter
VVFEPDGALFFGSGDRLLDEADALCADCRSLVPDLRQVSATDESGALALQHTVMRANRRGIVVKLAGLAEASPAGLAPRSFAPALALAGWRDSEHRCGGDARAHRRGDRHLLRRCGFAASIRRRLRGAQPECHDGRLGRRALNVRAEAAGATIVGSCADRNLPMRAVFGHAGMTPRREEDEFHAHGLVAA